MKSGSGVITDSYNGNTGADGPHNSRSRERLYQCTKNPRRSSNTVGGNRLGSTDGAPAASNSR